jgi:hypothetical protein
MGIEEILAGEFDLDIPNFEKWNPKTSAKRHWFALSKDWFLDPKMHDATSTQQLLWVKLLSVRAASSKRLEGVTVAWLQRRVGVQCASVRRDLLKLVKLRLVEIEKPLLHTIQTDITDRQAGVIHPELTGIDDLCFSKITLPAQEAWIKKYGIAAVREVVPIAHAAWIADRPVSKTGTPTPLPLYIDRCLQNRIKFGDAVPLDGPQALKKEMDKLFADLRGDA